MKKRLDAYLVESGLAGGRDAAKRLIGEGKIYVNGKRAEKPALDVSGASVELRGEGLRYVGRGGLKLEKALNAFKISTAGKIAADIGASSGGFTDCMLQNGAARVYAVDVGHGQLAKKLTEDARVVNLEGTDVRSLSLSEKVDLATVDVSFISLELVLPAVTDLLGDSGELVALIKPQFEVGRGKIGKNGIVKDEAARRAAVEKIVAFAQILGLDVRGTVPSPVRGGDGNIEYLMYAVKFYNRVTDEA